MSHQEIINQFLKEIRVYGVNRLSVFAVIANTMVYKCIPHPQNARSLMIKGYRQNHEIETVCTLNIV